MTKQKELKVLQEKDKHRHSTNNEGTNTTKQHTPEPVGLLALTMQNDSLVHSRFHLFLHLRPVTDKTTPQLTPTKGVHDKLLEKSKSIRKSFRKKQFLF
jgi:hypothetical protein